MQPGNFIQRIGRLLLREARLITADHGLLLTLLIAPVLYAFFYGSIYSNKVEEAVKLAITDGDNTTMSRLLVQQINNTQMIDVVRVPSVQQGEQLMNKGDCQGFLVIPEGLEKKVLSLQQANVVMGLNAARFLPSSDILSTVTPVCLTVSAGIRLQYMKQAEVLTSGQAMQQVMPVNLDYRPLFNERNSYGDFLLPGLLAIILQQTLLIGLSQSISNERRKGTVKDWLQQSGSRASTALLGKGFFYLLLFGAYAFFFMNVNFSILGLQNRAGFAGLSLIFFLFLITLIPMAIAIGSFFKSQLLNMQFMAFSTYPIFLITGYTWPFSSLPLPVQFISSLLPTTPFIKLYQSAVQTGASLSQNTGALVHLCLLMVLYTCIALIRINHIERKTG